ncbi:hypothetical protein NVP1162O_49 [Vibrio phage 1.162.O._10N.261.48.E3]|nr:hypothetical protein NVP1147O_49 [Vibrio phage 1.147.O._10N.286.49.E9]AUR91719.1 hypothetical protein NVP1162O_49 [Vibrio phage 1.162.O._10N.261.48.E3]
MYNFNDDELKKYRTNFMFRDAFERGCRAGLTKEEVLSKLSITILDEIELNQRELLEKIMHSSKPSIFGDLD